ncbi:MAG: hypothetical protein KatS3mg102_0480 [Planctomycetota bacterium]|nr:MAG: hypothetical protein KatS3mg102_0480 [Planctomycetota bacterium]
MTVGGIHSGGWLEGLGGLEERAGEAPPEAHPDAPRSSPGSSRGSTGASEGWRAHLHDSGAGVLASRLSEAALAGPASARMPALSAGAQGEAVRELQDRLNAHRERLGLPPLAADGSFGPATRVALQQFQRMRGLEPDGVAGPATWRKLLEEPPAVSGSPAPGGLEAKVLAHREAILAAARRTGVPPELIAGVIAKESSGLAHAVGPTGDKGLMQINERAHPEFFRRHDWRDPFANVRYGAQVLRHNLRAFAGDVDKAVAAYNAGIQGVRRGLAAGLSLEDITAAPNYVRDVLSYARRFAAYF